LAGIFLVDGLAKTVVHKPVYNQEDGLTAGQARTVAPLMVPFLSGLWVLGLSTIVSGVKATSLLADFGP
jgi:hypothetical protein